MRILDNQTKDAYKQRLEQLAGQYKEIPHQEELTEIIQLLTPLVNSRIQLAIYKMETAKQRRPSEREDLYQEIMMRVPKALSLWNEDRGTFYTFFNVYMNSRLKTWLMLKHRNASSRIIDHEISIHRKLFVEEVGEISLCDILTDGKIDQEQSVAVLELSKAVSEALSDEVDQVRSGYVVFYWFLRGYQIGQISKKVGIAEGTIRAMVRRVVRRVQLRLSTQYKDLYHSLQYPYSSLVNVQLLLDNI